MARIAASPARSGAGDSSDASLWRGVAWMATLAAWLFVVASLLGFDPADPPSHAAWPGNTPLHNWCGPAGAWVAYSMVKTLGVGAWVLVLGVGAILLMGVVGPRVRLVGLRVVGLAILACAAAAMQALLFPAWSAFPDLAGGVVGGEATAELLARFGRFGTFLWLALAMAVGAIVAFDRWLVLAPLWAGRRVAPAARMAGGLAVALREHAAPAARAANGPGMLGRLRGLWGRPRAAAAGPRLNDVDDDLPDGGVEVKPVRRSKRAPEAPAPEPAEDGADDPAGPGATLVVDEDEDAEIEADDADAEGEDDGGEDLPGAPQVFDPEALRAKIARLPIAFSHNTKRVATDADLRDLQNVGELEGYRFPGLDLLEEPEANFSARLEQVVRAQAEALESALRQYRIEGEVAGIESGPVITLYNVRLAPGTKVAQLQAVASDVARALKAVNIRIVSNMAGRDTVGVEVPNPTKERVRLKELMSKSESFARMKLPTFLGKDASGEPLIADLAQMPHMLIAGTTGSGKSVCMNTIIMGFLYTKKPSELKLVLVDPKMVEMSQFKDIPHLMCPVVTEMARAAAILEWACGKMDERYELLSEAGCRDIASYNELTWEELRERFNPQSPEEEARIPRKLPYMVFVIDELADLMMTAKEVEGFIIRIAQKARAVGIHLILATQRPQANVVTGLIKSNMPCRICFKVASGMDSRIVLDQKGGELLLGQGDMLYLSPRTSKLVRAQGTLVDDPEIRRVVRFMRDVAKPSFERQLMAIRTGLPEEITAGTENNSSASLAAAQEDPLFFRAVDVVIETKRGSVSLLQRRLAIGYTRASRLIDLMGIAGIISDHKGSVARDVLVSPEEWEAMKKQAAEDLAAGRGPAPRQGQLFGAGAASAGPAEEMSEINGGTALEEAPFDQAGDEPPGGDDGAGPEGDDEDESTGEEGGADDPRA